VLALHGLGDLEVSMPVLKLEDVRSINERSMTAQERQDHVNACRMAGLPEQGGIEEVEAAPMVSFNPRLALGEGHQRLLWIWYSVSKRELRGGSPEVEASGSPIFHPHR
jgi:hypothetical protein